MPSSRNLTISVSGMMYCYKTEAVIDSTAMIILIQEEYFRSIGAPSEWGVSFRGEHVMGKMIHNVLFTFGDQTLHPYLLFLHTVCVAPIKKCLCGLDFLKAIGCVLDLASYILEIAGNVFHIKVAASPELSVVRVNVAKRTVIPPNTVEYTTHLHKHTLRTHEPWVCESIHCVRGLPQIEGFGKDRDRFH